MKQSIFNNNPTRLLDDGVSSHRLRAAVTYHVNVYARGTVQHYGLPAVDVREAKAALFATGDDVAACRLTVKFKGGKLPHDLTLTQFYGDTVQ